MPASFPCQLKLCSESGGVAPSSDVTIYSLQDAIAFNSEDVSILVECLPGYYWPPGSCPQVITYRAGRFTIPIPPTTGGFPIVIQLQGCLSLVSITLPAGSTTAAIQVAANTVILQVAAQQAQCDAINPPEDDPNDPDGPGTPGGGGGGPNPLPRFFNQAVYYTCAMGLEFTGTLPTWVTVDDMNNRLVGSAGIFGGTTQISANSTAQGVLNAFAGSAISEGTLTCVCEFAGGSTLPEATEGELYSFTLTLAVGTPGTFSIQSGALPEGLALDSVTGEIRGIPTESGFFNVTVRMDKDGTFCVAALELLSNATECFNNPSPTGCGEIDQPFSTTLMPVFQILEGFPFQFAIVAGSLPTGLSLNTDTGVISGTPTAGGTFVYTAQLINGPITCTKEFSCTITSTLCFNPSIIAWSPYSFTQGGVASSSMVGANGSFNLQTPPVPPLAQTAALIRQTGVFTNNTVGGCKARFTFAYSYNLPASTHSSGLSFNLYMDGVFPPVMAHSQGQGTGIEFSVIGNVPQGVNNISFEIALSGSDCVGAGSPCLINTASGTITMEPLPP